VQANQERSQPVSTEEQWKGPVNTSGHG